MDRDCAATRTEASADAPLLSQTASCTNATTGHASDHLYMNSIDPSNLPKHSNINEKSRSGSSSSSIPRLKTATAPLRFTRRPAYWSFNAFELIANEAMSRQRSQGNNKVNNSNNSNNSPAQYQLMSSESPADQAKSLSQNNKDQLIGSLRTHRVNTITELRRIEKIFAYLNSEEVTEPMTAAWAHYVNSNNLLNELRGLTKKIPFSSECLDEAKALVVNDPASVRSWNYCWLVLIKMEKENLVLKYARALATKRSTWGDRQPTGDDARKFITACVAEWTQALRQMLKHWDNAPSTTGN